MVNGEMGQIMSYYGEKEKFPVSGLTSGLTTINRKKMTLPTQGRTLWAAKIVLSREVAEKRGEYTEKSSIDMKKPHIGDEKPYIDPEKTYIGNGKPYIDGSESNIESEVARLGLSQPTQENIIKLFNRFGPFEFFGRREVCQVTELQVSAASDLIRQMLRHRLLDTVKGHGKGKYRFRSEFSGANP